MPKKLRTVSAVPPVIAQRLEIWGRCIRAQRVSQNIPAADLCARLGISDATLRRMEHGDPGTGAATYLTALWILGILDTAVPPLDPIYWSANPQARARRSQTADDYF
jgi:transcriptional regulator with XRE-family HTH domain